MELRNSLLNFGKKYSVSSFCQIIYIKYIYINWKYCYVFGKVYIGDMFEVRLCPQTYPQTQKIDLKLECNHWMIRYCIIDFIKRLFRAR